MVRYPKEVSLGKELEHILEYSTTTFSYYPTTYQESISVHVIQCSTCNRCVHVYIHPCSCVYMIHEECMDACVYGREDGLMHGYVH